VPTSYNLAKKSKMRSSGGQNTRRQHNRLSKYHLHVNDDERREK
jgi:hypothetical protein